MNKRGFHQNPNLGMGKSGVKPLNTCQREISI